MTGLVAVAGAQDTGGWVATLALPPEPTSPRVARDLLRLVSSGWNLPELDQADLLLTEVVTNVVVHAHTSMVIRLHGDAERLRVEVEDCSPQLPRQRRANRRSEHGRGLLLLERLTSAWGVDPHATAGHCKTVWFELRHCGDNGQPDESDLHAAFDIDAVEAL